MICVSYLFAENSNNTLICSGTAVIISGVFLFSSKILELHRRLEAMSFSN